MLRYNHDDLNQTNRVPTLYADPIVDGSFEHALNKILEERLIGW
jgi:hypothetical protein